MQHLFSIHCSFGSCFSCVHCDHRSGMGRGKALQLHCSGLERNSSLLWLASSPNAGQYFQRLGGCSSRDLASKASPFPAPPPQLTPCLAVHQDQSPPFQTKVYPFLHLKSHTLSCLFLHITNPRTSSTVRVTRAGESSSAPQRKRFAKNVRVNKTLLIS